MQTFVPFADLDESASVLDSKRLNKQLLEGRQIYSILTSKKTTGAWVNHPAVKMWRNFDTALYSYLYAVYVECNNRGIKTDKNWQAIQEMHNANWDRGDNVVMPHWWGDERVHQSHRNNLYVKDPEYYAEFYGDSRVTCCETCNYFWPSHTLFYNYEFMNTYENIS
jgi:hypothetical protein